MSDPEPCVEERLRRPPPAGPADTWPGPGRSRHAFTCALDEALRAHGDTCADIGRALAQAGAPSGVATLRKWRRGSALPKRRASRAALAALAGRYGLPEQHFVDLLPIAGRGAEVLRALAGPRRERRGVARRLPSNYLSLAEADRTQARDAAHREAGGTTAFRRYQTEASSQPFALRFPELEALLRAPGAALADWADPGVAPRALREELAALIAFKTSPLCPPGRQRLGRWGVETARQRIHQLLLLFGALAAPPDGPVRGLGAPPASLCVALLISPDVAAWFLQWRHRRRGFFTTAEADVLSVLIALTQPGRGWLTQNPALANRLRPLPRLVPEDVLADSRRDWDAACAGQHAFTQAWRAEVLTLAQPHRDPFEPILPILASHSPVGEYRKIAAAILRRAPRSDRGRAAAEALRDYLMVRLALHLGLRQRNLRELWVCPLGAAPRSESDLQAARRGELRWRPATRRWEVFIPAVAFKNAGSRFFDGHPFVAELPDLEGLYDHLGRYLAGGRARLLGRGVDTGEFFVRPPRLADGPTAYGKAGFYEAWTRITGRYADTAAGLPPGVLPHGPHAVRDVIATHVLKTTGSFDLAAYAIQDTPETVRRHYGRFHPKDKVALAAAALNPVWDSG